MYRVVGSIETSTRCVSRRPPAGFYFEKGPSKISEVCFCYKVHLLITNN